MKKKSKLLLVSSIGILLTICTFVLSSCSVITTKIEYKGFSDINELSVVDPYVIEEIDPVTDSRLNDMEYNENYCKVVRYNNITYKLFAHVFENEQNAADYCDLEVISNKNYNYKYSGNIFFSNTLRVYSGNCAYIIEGNSHSDFADFYSFLSSEFTVTFK